MISDVLKAISRCPHAEECEYCSDSSTCEEGPQNYCGIYRRK